MTARLIFLEADTIYMDIEALLKDFPFAVDGYTITSNDGSIATVLIKCHDKNGEKLSIEARYVNGKLEFMGII